MSEKTDVLSLISSSGTYASSIGISCAGDDVAVGEEFAASCSERAAAGEVEIFGVGEPSFRGDTLGDVVVGEGVDFGAAVAATLPFVFSAIVLPSAEDEIEYSEGPL